MKKVSSIFLMFALLLTLIIPVSAANTPSPKEEVVYGLLNTDGSVKNLYVVNIFDGGNITDYGNYTDIRNLTSSEKINKNGDEITINTTADKFYYQGTPESNELPWNIEIRYFLDGKEIDGKDLGGKSGSLKILISIKRNSKVNSIFFNNYALQTTISLDNRLCSNIKADNATIAEAGNKKQIAFTILPGKDAEITITADVRDFEMEPVLINGIKLALNINIDTSEFTKQIAELTDAVKKLDDGASELLDGINQLSDGMQKYIDGIKAFKDGLEQIPAGINKLSEGASLLKNGLSELSKQNDFIMNGVLAIQQATFDSVNAQLSVQLGSAGFSIPVLTPENYNEILSSDPLSSIPDIVAVKQQLDSIIQFTQGLKSYLVGVSLLDAGASELIMGVSEFKNSSSTIVASANELYNAGAELNTAIKKLRDGLASYKAGTKEFREGTSDIDSEIDSKINEILDSLTGSDDKVVSFVSHKNTNVIAVQFVLKTDPISLPETQESVKSEPAKLTIWQRLLKLFGL